MVSEEASEVVKIGPKDISKYLSACFYALGKKDEVKIIARGNNVKRAIDVVAILKRQYIENPKCEITIDSEKFEDRYVSIIEITLKGKKKKNAIETKSK